MVGSLNKLHFKLNAAKEYAEITKKLTARKFGINHKFYQLALAEVKRLEQLISQL